MKSKTILVLALVTAGCSRDAWQRLPGPDDAIAAVPWFSTMRKTIAIMPYEMPLMPVEGTVPITGVEIPLPITTENFAAIERQQNPARSTAESIDRGRDRFDIYCSVCHGAGGAGDGPVNAKLFNLAPSLLTDQSVARSDGYLYSLIRHGRGIMPGYGDKIRGDDRWHVINYMRMLQGAAR